VLAYNTNGNALYATDVAGGMGYGISVDPLDNLCITGINYTANITFGSNPTLNNNGVYDVVVAKLGSTVGMVNSWNNVDNIAIYPNPCREFFYLDISSLLSIESSIIIYDIMGHAIFSTQQMVEGNVKLFIESISWPSGVYYVHITDNVHGHPHALRIVIE